MAEDRSSGVRPPTSGRAANAAPLEIVAPEITIRGARDDDAPFLWDMAYEAAFAVAADRPPRETIRELPLARYLTDWGRHGDRGVVAEVAGERAGAAWYRLFPLDDPGYGTVDPETPELSIAVAPEHRRRGVGAALLAALLDAAREDGFGAISLSVARENFRARGLYERFGFRIVGTKDDSLTMLR